MIPELRFSGVFVFLLVTVLPLFGVLFFRHLKGVFDRRVSELNEANRRTAWALQQSEERFRLAIETIEDYAVFTLDTEGHVTSWNRGAERLKGYTKEEIIGQHFSIFYPPEALSVDQPRAILFEARTTGHFREEGWRVRKDGSQFFANVCISAIYDAFGTLTGFTKITNDITKKHQAEIDLQDMNTHLEQRIQERTYELEKAKEEALEASRLKSEFLANMSHEIRTPMNGVLGIAELVLNTSLTSEQYNYIEMIQSSGNALMTIINDILDFSKIEAGKLELDDVPFLLREKLDEILNLFSQSALKKGLKLVCTVAPDIPNKLSGDPMRLRQILNNLIGNALKFTKQGEILLNVNLTEQDAKQVQLYFEVVDSGIGITPEQCQRIFESFVQADGSTSRQYGGTGLGLAISRRLVQMMGGEMGVKSRYGEGSTFYFTLPLEVMDTPHVPNLPTGTDTQVLLREQRRPLKVLLAEDNLINQAVTVGFLQKVGYQVVIASNGGDAIERFKTASFDLILMDVTMPEIDGFEATRQIRELEQVQGKQSIPIIALTANALKGDEERCLAVGMNGYLSKPYKNKDLIDLIDTLAPSRSVLEAATTLFPFTH